MHVKSMSAAEILCTIVSRWCMYASKILGEVLAWLNRPFYFEWISVIQVPFLGVFACLWSAYYEFSTCIHEQV
jgi:hypothetical protein